MQLDYLKCSRACGKVLGLHYWGSVNCNRNKRRRQVIQLIWTENNLIRSARNFWTLGPVFLYLVANFCISPEKLQPWTVQCTALICVHCSGHKSKSGKSCSIMFFLVSSGKGASNQEDPDEDEIRRCRVPTDNPSHSITVFKIRKANNVTGT